MAEFARLREDVEKKGMVAKTASLKRPPREEMCKYVTAYADAEATWVKFTVSGVQSCGIPQRVADQLKQVHSNTERTREKVCAPPPPPLSISSSSRGLPGAYIQEDSALPALRRFYGPEAAGDGAYAPMGAGGGGK
jgi:hypothetical protein